MIGIRILTLALAGWAALGQDAGELFEKAPPHVEAALKERISTFYRAHVDGKFRLADAVVHEDSKDAFFGSKKEQIRGFEIIRIQYSDNFTKATAAVAVDTDFLMPGFGKRQVKIPLTTLWKLDNGLWWWYVRVPGEGIETPFGTMKPGEASREEVLSRLGTMPNADAIRRQISVSKTEVALSAFEISSDEIVVANGMPGTVTLELTCPSMPGLEAKVERKQLGAGERAKLLFHYEPPNRSAKDPVQASLRVLPTNHVIPIRVNFAPPPVPEAQEPKP